MKAILDKAVPLKGTPEISLALTAPKSEWAALQELQRADPNPELVIISVAEYDRLSGTNPTPDVLEAVSAQEISLRIVDHLEAIRVLNGRLLELAEPASMIGYRVAVDTPLPFDEVPRPMGCGLPEVKKATVVAVLDAPNGEPSGFIIREHQPNLGMTEEGDRPDEFPERTTREDLEDYMDATREVKGE